MSCTLYVYIAKVKCSSTLRLQKEVVMIEISVKEARSKLSHLLDRVEKGEEIAITRRGEKVALLVSPEKKKRLPKLAAFRSSLKVRGKTLSETVIEERRDHRY